MKAYMLLVDIAMLLVLPSLFAPLMTGLPLHELAGLIFFVLVIFHLLFSWSWIKMSTKNLSAHEPIRKKFNYLLNLILYVLLILQVISGLAISHVALPFLGIKTNNDLNWRGLHNQAFQLIVILLCLHIALNWKIITVYFKRRLKTERNKNTLPVIHILHAIKIIEKMLLRMLLLLLAVLMVSVITFLVLGVPAATGPDMNAEIERLQPRLVPGIVQFTGAVIVISILTYMAKRWLKLRL